MDLFWADYGAEERWSESSVARGYVTMIRALRFRLGLRSIVPGYAARMSLRVLVNPHKGPAPTILHVVPPQLFAPIQGATNVLFTMWEAGALPRTLLEAVHKAQACIVPSVENHRIWASHGYDSHIVPLGISDAFVGLPARDALPKPHRYLWLGSMIARKGFDLVAPAWREAFSYVKEPPQLYVKTIRVKGAREYSEHLGGLVTIDTRDLAETELVELYRSTDVYVSTSHGEGFGLTTLEAMAAGCLVLSPSGGGSHIDSATALLMDRSGLGITRYGRSSVGSLLSVEDVARGLKRSWTEWGSPRLEALRNNGQAVARTYSWDASAKRLREVLEEIAVTRAA